MPYWNDDNNNECNKFEGTDGLQFEPKTEKDDVKISYVDELCRYEL